MAACLASLAATAQQPAPSGVDPAMFAAKRFPQPVQVADLIGRRVLQPLESRPVLGHVKYVVRQSDGRTAVVIDYGGFLGLRSRLIAIPTDAMALLGDEMAILDFVPRELDRFPTFQDAVAVLLPREARIHVGLARPSH
jgi:hypothetical protein